MAAPDEKATTVELDGLTHSCTDPECHVPAFVDSLTRRRASAGDPA